MPKLILIDDHAILRSGARALIERHMADMDIAEAGGLGEALSLIAGGFDADLAVLDIMLPDARGMDGLMQFRTTHPTVPVVILSGAEDLRDRMMALGAAAFVPKNGEALEIVAAIRAVLDGESYEPGRCSDQVAWEALSQRQREIARLCAEGHSNKEIGRLLGISDNTVRAHLTLIFRRFGLKSRADLSALAGGTAGDDLENPAAAGAPA